MCWSPLLALGEGIALHGRRVVAPVLPDLSTGSPVENTDATLQVEGALSRQAGG